MVVLSLQKIPERSILNAVRIENSEAEFSYSRSNKKIIKNYVYYSQKRVIA